MMRNTLIIAGLVVLMFAFGVWFFLSNIDGIVKSAIEKYGSQITHVTVNVGEVSISPKSGEGKLRHLMVDSPDGFTVPFAFSFGNIDVKVDVQSLTTETVLIHEFNAIAPDVNVEQNATGNNIHTITRSIQEFLNSQSQDPKAEGKKFIIDSLRIQDAQLHVSAPLVQAEVVTVPLSDIHLTHIGKDSGGVPASVVLAMVMQAVNTQIAEAVASRGLQNMVDITPLDTKNTGVMDQIRGFFN